VVSSIRSNGLRPAGSSCTNTKGRHRYHQKPEDCQHHPQEQGHPHLIPRHERHLELRRHDPCRAESGSGIRYRDSKAKQRKIGTGSESARGGEFIATRLVAMTMFGATQALKIREIMREGQNYMRSSSLTGYHVRPPLCMCADLHNTVARKYA
jgi:hypothetical protein